MNNIDCLESDWKLFRKMVPQWQEAFMGKLVEEYKEILDSDGLASEKFWALEKRVNGDKRSPGVLIDMRRSRMRDNILGLLQWNVIKLGDLEGFSPELQEDMAHCVKGMKAYRKDDKKAKNKERS